MTGRCKGATGSEVQWPSGDHEEIGCWAPADEGADAPIKSTRTLRSDSTRNGAYCCPLPLSRGSSASRIQSPHIFAEMTVKVSKPAGAISIHGC